MEAVELIRSLSSPMTVKTTGEEPQVEVISGIKAVIFDIYGTLFLSGSSEISLGESDQKDHAMTEVLQDEGIVTSPAGSEITIPSQLSLPSPRTSGRSRNSDETRTRPPCRGPKYHSMRINSQLRRFSACPCQRAR